MFRNSSLSNNTAKGIFLNSLTAILALFVNGFGIYLTMKANIGAAPRDVLNLGLSKSLGILYGTASISVSVIILLIDISMKESIGLAMFIDAIVVGKSVDFFNYTDFVPAPQSLPASIVMLIVGSATLIGFLLGGPVGIGTIICALFQGPIMAFAFKTLRFDATNIKHENLLRSFSVIAASMRNLGHRHITQ